MKSYQTDFIQLCVDNNILSFGQFTLKSGRMSPYFFNAGLFNDGNLLNQLGSFYAQTLVEAGIEFDVIFGPAYKGIPLACITASMLALNHQVVKPYAFNRKEIKDHGEGGSLVGAEIYEKKVLIIDDVITAGTAIHESMTLLKQQQASLAAVLIALDRQEKNSTGVATIKAIESAYSAPVISIINLDDILQYAKEHLNPSQLEHIQNYRQQYGV